MHDAKKHIQKNLVGVMCMLALKPLLLQVSDSMACQGGQLPVVGVSAHVHRRDRLQLLKYSPGAVWRRASGSELETRGDPYVVNS